MNQNDVKLLLSKVEYLGCDTQSLRDLLGVAQVTPQIINAALNILITLSSIITAGNFSPNSSPLQVDLLLQQLSERINNFKLGQPVSPGVTPLPVFITSPAPNNDELLSVLKDLRNDINEIKNKPTPPAPAREVVHVFTAPSAENSQAITADSTVFIPKVDNMEGSQSIKIKEGESSGLESKLERLRKLKRGEI